MEKEEIKTEETKVKGMNKGLIVLIFVAVIVLAGVIFVGAFNLGRNLANLEEEVVNGDNEKEQVEDENKEEKEVEQLTKDSVVVKELLSIYTEVQNGVYDVHKDRDLSKDNVKKSIVLAELEKEGKITKKTCGSLNNTYVKDEYFCDPYNAPYDDNGNIDYSKYPDFVKDSETDTYKQEDVKAKYLELFGKNVKYNDVSFEMSFPGLYAYFDEKNNLYAKFSIGGGSEAIDAEQVIESVEHSGTTLKIFTSINFVDGTSKKVNYTFEYEKETGNYIFVSREAK